MAHKKAASSSDNGRDSNPNYLGVKLFGGEIAFAGNILVRQRGTKYHPGDNVYMGRDHTLHAKVDGEVYFRRKAKNRMFVNIAPIVDETVATPTPKPVKKAVKKAVPAPVVEVQPLAAVATPAPVVEAKPVTPAPVVEAKPAKAAKPAKIALPSGKKITQDDLKMVEGIGPKIEGLLHDAGIMTWKMLAEAPEERVKAILTEAGPRYQMHQPKTWATQARLAHESNWTTLERYQDWLDGGREIEGETFDFNA